MDKIKPKDAIDLIKSLSKKHKVPMPEVKIMSDESLDSSDYGDYSDSLIGIEEMNTGFKITEFHQKQHIIRLNAHKLDKKTVIHEFEHYLDSLHGVVRLDCLEGEGVYRIQSWVDINKVYFLTFDLSGLEKNKEIKESVLVFRIVSLARILEKAKRIGLRVIYKPEISAYHKYEELRIINGTDYITGLKVKYNFRAEDNVEPPSVTLPSEGNLDDVVILFNKLNEDFKLGFQEMYKIIKKEEPQGDSRHITVFELLFNR